jgi:hypothetical protein
MVAAGVGAIASGTGRSLQRWEQQHQRIPTMCPSVATAL